MDSTTTGVLLDYLPAASIPVIVVLSFFLNYFMKKYDKCEEEKSQLAKDVIKLTVLFENHSKYDSIAEMIEKLNNKINELHR
jgi:hypothetical protein